MKILMLSDTFPPEITGGAARTALTQARALSRLGHDVSVLSTRRDATLPAEVEVDGIPVHRLVISYPIRWQPYLSLYHPGAARSVEHYLATHAVDVIHAHNIHAYLTYHSLTLAHRKRVPVLLTMHDTMTVTYQKFDEYINADDIDVPTQPDYRVSALSQIRRQRLRYFPFRNKLIRRVLTQNVDAMLFPGRALIDVLTSNGIQHPRMIHIPNGIDLTEFATLPEERAVFRQHYNLTDKRVILLAGRINQAKGGLQMLQALPQIVAAVPNTVLFVLSPPSGYNEGMSSIAESLGIRHYIRFAGWLSGRELACAFGSSDVMVTPSIYFDNFPTVNLEAMAAGTPVVATCFGGSSEAVIDGETGFIVNPYHLERLAERIIIILADDALRAQLSKNAQHRASTHYDWLAQGARLVEIYQQLRM